MTQQPTPDELRLARRIVAEAQFGPSRWREADVLLSGRIDDTANVQIALAAIRETSELAAKLADARKDARFSDHGMTEPDTNHSYYPGRYGETLECLDEEDDEIATNLRNGDHLKGPAA